MRVRACEGAAAGSDVSSASALRGGEDPHQAPCPSGNEDSGQPASTTTATAGSEGPVQARILDHGGDEHPFQLCSPHAVLAGLRELQPQHPRPPSPDDIKDPGDLSCLSPRTPPAISSSQWPADRTHRHLNYLAPTDSYLARSKDLIRPSQVLIDQEEVHIQQDTVLRTSMWSSPKSSRTMIWSCLAAI